MDAPTQQPTPRPAEREARPRRGYRAVPMVLVVVLLAVNVGLTGRAVWRLERQAVAPQPPTLAEILEGLAGAGQAPAAGGRKGPAPQAGPALSFDSVAVLPFTGPEKERKAAQVEAEKLAPALAALLAKDRRVRVVPFEKVREVKEQAPQAAGRALGARAVLTGALSIRTFVDATISVSMQLVDVETGLVVWAKTTELGPYSEGAVEWKAKLTEALVAAAGQVRAHSGERAP